MAAQSNSTTAQEFLDIHDITNNLVVLKNGTVSFVLTVSAMNFGLLAEQEQDAVIYTYAAMLNSLNYPVQIVVQSQTKDATQYLRLLQEQEKEAGSERKAKMIARYRQFVADLIKQRNVLDKKFYVAAPANAIELGLLSADSVIPGRNDFDITKFEKSKILEKAQSILEPRRDHLISQFARIGLYARQLKTQEIIKVFYTNYNPEASEGLAIADTSEYTTPLVRASFMQRQKPQRSPQQRQTPQVQDYYQESVMDKGAGASQTQPQAQASESQQAPRNNDAQQPLVQRQPNTPAGNMPSGEAGGPKPKTEPLTSPTSSQDVELQPQAAAKQSVSINNFVEEAAPQLKTTKPQLSDSNQQPKPAQQSAAASQQPPQQQEKQSGSTITPQPTESKPLSISEDIGSFSPKANQPTAANQSAKESLKNNPDKPVVSNKERVEAANQPKNSKELKKQAAETSSDKELKNVLKAESANQQPENSSANAEITSPKSKLNQPKQSKANSSEESGGAGGNQDKDKLAQSAQQAINRTTQQIDVYNQDQQNQAENKKQPDKKGGLPPIPEIE